MVNNVLGNASVRVVLSMRITQASGYDEARDSISHDWIRLLQGWGMAPFPLPNDLADPAACLDAIGPELLVLTGGGDPGLGTPRDRTEKIMLDYSAAKNTPVLGVCRGLQAINLHFGGGLGAIARHVAERHAVKLAGAFSDLYGAETTVNSFHESAVPADGLAHSLVAAGVDEDGNIEALHHTSLPMAAIMWHPERPGAPEADRLLVERLVEEGAFWH
jgi:N5-(cytidine 5'-diphosphoramidyl)-L-glutamine hydrolase